MNKHGANLIFDMKTPVGQSVHIRPITPQDAQIEWDFVHNLSAQSRYYRFLGGVRDLTPQMLEYFTTIDFTTSMALIALVKGEDNVEKEIAVGRFFVLPNQVDCEFAIVVDDHWQGMGIGYQMMKMLIQDAKSKKLLQMNGEIFAQNKTMLKIAQDLGFEIKSIPNDSSLKKVILKLT